MLNPFFYREIKMLNRLTTALKTNYLGLLLKTKRQEKEIDKLKEALIDNLAREIYIDKFLSKSGEVSMNLHGGGIHFFSAIVIKEFLASGATNFLEVDMHDKNGETYSLSIQKASGITPSQKVKKAAKLAQVLISETSSLDEKTESLSALKALFPSKQ